MIMGGNTMINDKELFYFKIFGHQVEVIVVMSELCPEGKMNMAGWWFQPTPLNNMSSSVGATIPNWMEQ